MWQKRPTDTLAYLEQVSKGTYLHGKRGLFTWQKRPTDTLAYLEQAQGVGCLVAREERDVGKVEAI